MATSQRASRLHKFSPTRFIFCWKILLVRHHDMNRPTLLCGLVAILIMVSAGARAQSLCIGTETEYFSCRIQQSVKILSICGSSLESIEKLPNRSNAWLQYRYGPPGKPELTFPSVRHGSLDAFAHERHTGYQTLTFSIGSESYTVFAVQNIETEEISKGVEVSMKNKKTALRCNDEGLAFSFYSLVFALAFPSYK